MKSQSFTLQSGFTLLEMVIGLGVIVLVLVLTTMSFDQNSGRAKSLEAKMQLVRAGVLRFQTDLPCGPAKLSALTVREDAAVGLCGDANDLNNWHGPYMESGSTYAKNGDLDISNILPDAGLSIIKTVVVSVGRPGTTTYVMLKVSAISDEMHSAVVALCADACTPYKNITNDVDTIGILVSGLFSDAFSQSADIVAFGVTPPGTGTTGTGTGTTGTGTGTTGTGTTGTGTTGTGTTGTGTTGTGTTGTGTTGTGTTIKPTPGTMLSDLTLRLCDAADTTIRYSRGTTFYDPGGAIASNYAPNVFSFFTNYATYDPVSKTTFVEVFSVGIPAGATVINNQPYVCQDIAPVGG